ncbi:uncharacterized protein C2orf92 homolog isoform X2 [Tamandua tetradactyla]|uniref:uncharacterized protein C2orf92 homolog isoform X2 n=1 Tax=Tamandua tetradactyla TaxID=48850 RepID=UPI004054682D
MRGAAVLFFVLFLDCGQSANLQPRHVTKGSPQQKNSKNTEFAPSSNKQEEKLVKILDEILQQVVSTVPDNPTSDEISSTAKSTTEIIMKSSYPKPNFSKNIEFSSNPKLQELFRKIFDEILQQMLSKTLYDATFDEKQRTAVKFITKNARKQSNPQPEILKNTEFPSSSIEPLGYMAKVFDVVPQQVFSKVLYDPTIDETKSSAAISTTETIIKPIDRKTKTFKNTEFTLNSKSLMGHLREIFDEIIWQELSRVPYNPALDEVRRTTAMSTTEKIMRPIDRKTKTFKNTEFTLNSKSLMGHLREIFDEIIWQELSRVPYNPALDEIRRTTATPITEKVMKPSQTQRKYLKRTEFASNFKEQEKNLSEIFDEIVQQVLSKVPYNPVLDERRSTAAKSTLKNVMNPNELQWPRLSAVPTFVETASTEANPSTEGIIKQSFLQPKVLKHTKFVSNVKKQKNLSEIFDEILQQVFYKIPYNLIIDESSTAAKSTTKNIIKQSHPQTQTLENSKFASSSVKPEERMAKIFDEILRQGLSKFTDDSFHEMRHTAAKSSAKNIANPSYPQPQTLENTELASSSVKPDESMAKMFDEILRHRLYNFTYNPRFHDVRNTAAKSTTKNVINPGYSQTQTLEETESAPSSVKPDDSMEKMFNEILRQRLYNFTYKPRFHDVSTAAKSSTKNIINPNEILRHRLYNFTYKPRFHDVSTAAKSSTKNIINPSELLKQRISKVTYNPAFHEVGNTATTSTTKNVINPSYPQPKTLENTEFVSSSIKPEDSMAKIFGELLRQKFSNFTYNHDVRSTTATSTTKNAMIPSYPQPKTLENTEFTTSSVKPDDSMAKIFDEILRQKISKVINNPTFHKMGGTATTSTTKLIINPSYPQTKTSENTELQPTSFKPEGNMAKIFNKILRQGLSSVTYNPIFHEMPSTEVESTTKNVINPNDLQPQNLENTEFKPSSFKPEDSMAKIFDEILRKGLSKVTYSSTFHEMPSTEVTSTTKNIVSTSYPQPKMLENTEFVSSSFKPENSMAKIFDEILRQGLSNITYNPSTEAESTTKNVINTSYPHPQTYENAEFASSSSKPEVHMAEIFDEILKHRLSNLTYNPKFLEKRSTAAVSITKNVMNLRYTQKKALKHSIFPSNLKNQDENLTEIFDEILERASSKVPYNPKFDATISSAAKSTTKNIMETSYPQQKTLKYTEFSSNLKKQEKNMTKILDEILGHASSKVPYNPKFDDMIQSEAKSTTKNIMEPSSPQQKTSKNTEFASSSIKPAEQMAKVFNEFLRQGFSRIPYNPILDETRSTAAYSSKKNFMKEEARIDENSPKPENFLRGLDTISNNEPLTDEKKVKEAYASDRKEKGRFTADTDEEDLQTAGSDAQHEKPPCAQTLHFLQKNIIIAAVSVAGLLVAMVALLLLLAMCGRGRQALEPPANTTYNIFIMNGKTWWQKFQEHANPRKSVGKQEELRCDSYI